MRLSKMTIDGQTISGTAMDVARKRHFCFGETLRPRAGPEP